MSTRSLGCEVPPNKYHDTTGDDENGSNHLEKNLPVDTLCTAVVACVAQSGDYRKVVSHVFGRNKKCTVALPEDSWILWCRKHYQRLRYRAENEGSWHTIQLRLVRLQLDRFEASGVVQSWNIAIKKAEMDALNTDDGGKVAKQIPGSAGDHPKCSSKESNEAAPCWERFLLPLLGERKTFADVRTVLGLIETEFQNGVYHKRHSGSKTFPAIEFLPIAHLKPDRAQQNSRVVAKVSHKRKAPSVEEKARIEVSIPPKRRRRLVRGFDRVHSGDKIYAGVPSTENFVPINA